VSQHHISDAEAAEPPVGHLIQTAAAQEHLHYQRQRRKRGVLGYLNTAYDGGGGGGRGGELRILLESPQLVVLHSGARTQCKGLGKP
jgi:hypothetical protein